MPRISIVQGPSLHSQTSRCVRATPQVSTSTSAISFSSNPNEYSEILRKLVGLQGGRLWISKSRFTIAGTLSDDFDRA